MFGAPANADDPRGLEARGDDMYYNQVLPPVQKGFCLSLLSTEGEKSLKDIEIMEFTILKILQTFSRRHIVNSLPYQVYYI